MPLLRGDAQVDDLARLRHVVGQLLVAARGGLAAARPRCAAGVSVSLSWLAWNGARPRRRTRPGWPARTAPALTCAAMSAAWPACASSAWAKRACACSSTDEAVPTSESMAARCSPEACVQRLQQRAQPLQQHGALLQREVVALGHAAHLLAQLRDHAGGRLRHLGRGLQQARERRLQRGAQRGQVLRDGGLQVGQALDRRVAAPALFLPQGGQVLRDRGLQLAHALHGRVATPALRLPQLGEMPGHAGLQLTQQLRRRFAALALVVPQRGQFRAPDRSQGVHALAMLLQPARFGVGARLHQLARLRQQPARPAPARAARRRRRAR